MILSAVSVWKKFDTSTPLNPSEWEEKEDKAAGMRFWNVTYSGHKTEDGGVRIFARFGKPSAKVPRRSPFAGCGETLG